jgi:hypothetical protein
MKRHLPIVLVAVVVAVGAFFGGITYAGSTAKSGGQPGARNGQWNGQPRSGANRAGGAVAGEVLAKDDKSLTVKLADGGSRLVFYSPSTSVVTAVSSTVADIAVGKQVMVTGSAGSDGSVTANLIQVGFPSFPRRAPGAGAPQN